MGTGPSTHVSTNKQRPPEYGSRAEPNRKFESYHLPFLKKKKSSKFPSHFLKSKKSNKEVTNKLPILQDSSHVPSLRNLASSPDYSIVTKNTTDAELITRSDISNNSTIPEYENSPIKLILANEIKNDFEEEKEMKNDNSVQSRKDSCEKVDENVNSSVKSILTEHSSQESLSEEKSSSSVFVDAAEDLQSSFNESKIKEELKTENKTAATTENNTIGKTTSFKNVSPASSTPSSEGKKEPKQESKLKKRFKNKKSAVGVNILKVSNVDTAKQGLKVLNNASLAKTSSASDEKSDSKQQDINPSIKHILDNDLQLDAPVIDRRNKPFGRKTGTAIRKTIEPSLREMNQESVGISKSKNIVKVQKRKPATRTEICLPLKLVNDMDQDLNLNNKSRFDAFDEGANLLTIKLNNNLLKLNLPDSRATEPIIENTLPPSEDKLVTLESYKQIEVADAALKDNHTRPPPLAPKINKANSKENIRSVNLVAHHTEIGNNGKSSDVMQQNRIENSEIVTRNISNNQISDSPNPIYSNSLEIENLAKQNSDTFIVHNEVQSNAKNDMTNIYKADVANKMQHINMPAVQLRDANEATPCKETKPRLTFEANNALDELNKKYSKATDDLQSMLTSRSHEDFLVEFKELLEPVIQKPQLSVQKSHNYMKPSPSDDHFIPIGTDDTVIKDPVSVIPLASVENSHNPKKPSSLDDHFLPTDIDDIMIKNPVSVVPQALLQNPSISTEDNHPSNEEDFILVKDTQETTCTKEKSTSSSSSSNANILCEINTSSSGSNTSNMAESEWDDDENSQRLYSSANEIKTQLVEDLMRSSEVNLGDFQQFLELDVTISQKYHYLPFEDLLRSNIEAGITIDDLGRSLRVLAKYGLDLMKTEPERHIHSRKILLNENFLESNCLSMPGFLEILRNFGYEEQGDSLIFTETLDNEPIALAVWVIEILLAAHELNFYHLGIHPHPQLFLPYFAPSF